jgi:hypothetical protein
MSSLVVLCLSSHYRIVLLPHYELVPPLANVGYVQTISNDYSSITVSYIKFQGMLYLLLILDK